MKQRLFIDGVEIPGEVHMTAEMRIDPVEIPMPGRPFRSGQTTIEGTFELKDSVSPELLRLTEKMREMAVVAREATAKFTAMNLTFGQVWRDAPDPLYGKPPFAFGWRATLRWIWACARWKPYREKVADEVSLYGVELRPSERGFDFGVPVGSAPGP